MLFEYIVFTGKSRNKLKKEEGKSENLDTNLSLSLSFTQL